MGEEGRLTKWNDDRGFGFISPSNGTPNVFVHISAFPKDGYRPKIGERLVFTIEIGKDGKKRAGNLDCPERPKKSVTHTHSPRNDACRPRKGKRSGLGTAWGLVILISMGVYAYIQSGSTLPFHLPFLNQKPQQVESSNFKCDGRVHCSQMRSCDEAKFFLKNCPGVMMDGNHDGVPCEQQWCN